MGSAFRDLADKTGLSYEHVRKPSRGQTCPSFLALKEICTVLQVDVKKMEKLVTADKIRYQFGEIPDEIAGKNPELVKIEQAWQHLTVDQKSGIEAQVLALVRINQERA